MKYKIAGLGIDIVEVKRFLSFRDGKSAFVRKVFTFQELKYCLAFRNRAEHLAGIFAAKEAVVKSSGGKVNILNIEIRHNRKGKPLVFVKKELRRNILVSISHTEKFAIAVAIKL